MIRWTSAPLCHAISLMYCTPAGLDGGGAGLGAMWGTELAGQMLARAGFGQVDVLDSPRPQNCIFVCRPPVTGNLGPEITDGKPVAGPGPGW